MKAVDLLKKCIEQLEQMSQKEFDEKVTKIEEVYNNCKKIN